MIWILWAILAAAGAWAAFRYLSLKQALREMHRELSEICGNLSQNRILHLPIPDRDLEHVMISVNAALEEIRRERQNYEKREAEFQKLIENISHDLRTPLTVILGYLKWMKGENDAKALETIEQNARAMENLVSQFYDFSRLNARDYALDLEDVDVCRILRECIAANCLLLEAAGLDTRILLPKCPVPVRGSSHALERIFSNLLQNAAKYAFGRLEIRLEESGGEILISFLNDTERMKEEDFTRLFDRFYRMDSSRRRRGSGLGLTVARSLAELMGGTLAARLPAARPAEAEGEGPVSIEFVLTLMKAPHAPDRSRPPEASPSPPAVPPSCP